MCNVEIDGDRLTLRPTLGALGGHYFFAALGVWAIWYGVETFPRTDRSPEYLAFAPIGVLMLVGGALWYRVSRRPLVLNRAADRAGQHPESLSSAIKVVVDSERMSENDSVYVAVIVFPEGRFRLARSGWTRPSLPPEADDLAKQVAAFLGVPAEPYFKPDAPVLDLFGLLGGARKGRERSGVE